MNDRQLSECLALDFDNIFWSTEGEMRRLLSLKISFVGEKLYWRAPVYSFGLTPGMSSMMKKRDLQICCRSQNIDRICCPQCLCNRIPLPKTWNWPSLPNSGQHLKQDFVESIEWHRHQWPPPLFQTQLKGVYLIFD